MRRRVHIPGIHTTSRLRGGLLLAALLLLVASCTQTDDLPDYNPQFKQADPSGSQARIHSENRELAFRRVKSGTASTSDVVFTLRYLIDGPDIGGIRVQASHIAHRQGNLYVSYNTAGPEIAGGFDRISLPAGGSPDLVSVQTGFSEYSSLEVITDPVTGKSDLILAGAARGPSGEMVPQAQFFSLDGSGVPRLNPLIRSLNGFVATDVNAYGLVTGTRGGIYQIESASEGVINYLTDLDDARSVAYNPLSGEFVVLLGNPGRLVTGLPGSMKIISLGGLSEGEIKAMVRLHNGYALATLGEGGLKVIKLSTGEVTAHIPRPEIPSGENPANYLTNGVSVDESGRVFIANGGAGIYVGQLGADGSLEIHGLIDMDASVNFIEAKGDFVYAAIGHKGLAIIEMAGFTAGLPSFSSVRMGTVSAQAGEVFADIRHDGGHPVLSRGFCWSQDDVPTIEDSKTLCGSGIGSYSGSMYNLKPDTRYLLRAFATTEAGTSYSEPIAFNTPDQEGDLNVFTDPRDGHVYKYIKMGNQVWMAENLAYLPQVDRASFGSISKPTYYVYDYHGYDVEFAKKSANYARYGVLYNYAAAREACPPGWHLPSDEEWKELERFMGMTSAEADEERFRYSGSVGVQLKSRAGWNNSGNGEENGFNALPGGFRNKGGTFEDKGTFGAYWTSTEKDLHAGYRGFFDFNTGVYRDFWYYTGGFSIRCVRN